MFRNTLLGILAGGLLASAVATAADPASGKTDWPQWRGPHRDGRSPDKNLLTKWPKGGPPLLWDAAGAGRGYASVVIADGRVYTLGDGPSTASDTDEYVLCFNEANGKQLWKTKLGPAWNEGSEDWQSSRSTPTVDGDRVYALSAHGDLVCLDAATGKEQWRKNLEKDFGGHKADSWGYSESVLIDGDRLICTPGGPKATMVALDKNTGKLIWKAVWPQDRGAGHASPVIAEVGGTRVYVQTTGGGALGVRAADGKVLWTYPIPGTTAVIPTPVVRGDLVFFTAGYNRGGALLRQVPTADKGVTVEEVYPLNTDLANRHGGVVLVGDYLYGDSENRGVPWCAEFKTGKIRWKKRGSGGGSAAVTYADGHLYFRYANGTMALAEASPKGHVETGSFKIPHSGERPSWAIPVVAGGKLFLREGDHILCYDLRRK